MASRCKHPPHSCSASSLQSRKLIWSRHPYLHSFSHPFLILRVYLHLAAVCLSLTQFLILLEQEVFVSNIATQSSPSFPFPVWPDTYRRHVKSGHWLNADENSAILREIYFIACLTSREGPKSGESVHSAAGFGFPSVHGPTELGFPSLHAAVVTVYLGWILYSWLHW